MFYLYVTISAAQARESYDLRHAMSSVSLFCSSFLGTQRILGYVKLRRRRCDVTVLQRPWTETQHESLVIYLNESEQTPAVKS